MMNDDMLCCSKPRTVETNRQIDIGNSNRENAANAIKRKSTSRIRAKNKRARRKVPNDVKPIDTASNSDSLPKLELDKTKLSTSAESTRIETADPSRLGDFFATELVEESRTSLGNNGRESWRHLGGQKHDHQSVEASPVQLSDNSTTSEILLQLTNELKNSKHFFKCNFRLADPLQISLMAEKLTTRTIEDSLTEVLEEDNTLLL